MSDSPAPRPLFVFDILPDGTAQAAAGVFAPVVAGGYRWMHFDLGDPGLDGWAEAALPRLAARTLLAPKTRPRVDSDDDGALVIALRGINLNAGAEEADMVSLRMWVTETLVVTVRRDRVFAVEEIRAQVDTGDAPPSPARLVARIVEGLVDRIEAVADELEDIADDLEDDVYENGRTPLRALSPLRRKVIKLRRHVAPLSDALQDLGQVKTPLIKGAMKNRLRESANRCTRALEELAEVHDRLGAMADHLDMAQAARLENNGYRLSVAAAIFLPLGIITGLFGVNVGGMPGVDHPHAFWWLTASMVVLAVAVYVIFRLRRWF